MSTQLRHPSTYPPASSQQKSDNVTAQDRRKMSSRIPTTKSAAVTPSAIPSLTNSNRTGQPTSHLAKRSSGGIPGSSRTAHGVDSTAAARTTSTVSTAAHVKNTPSKFGTTAMSHITDPNTTRLPHRSPSNSRNSVLAPPPTLRTPSLVSGSVSSASTFDSPRSNGLRRKPSTIERYAAAKRAETPSTQTGVDYNDAFDNSVLGIALPETASPETMHQFRPSENRPRLPSDANTREQQGTRDVISPVHAYAPSATPTTRYTDSPFSHAPTPSSASSYSSVMAVSTSGPAPVTQKPQSPTRTRNTAQPRAGNSLESSRIGLTTLRETSTSRSSSNATIKAASRIAATTKESTKKSSSASVATSTSRLIAPSTSRGKLVKNPPQRKQPTSQTHEKGEVPPELAHLNVDVSVEQAVPKGLPPPRPSRDGTPHLDDLGSTSVIVQSELPQVYSTYHKRTPSQDAKPTPPTTASPSLKLRLGFSSKSPSKQVSPRVDSAISPTPSTQPFARIVPTEYPSVDSPRLIRKDSPAVVNGASPAKTPRFGFFHRKPKEEGKTAEKPKRPQTKGPAAGTGHEGYGKFNNSRGRGSGTSAGTTSSFGFRSPSADSITSSQSAGTSKVRKGSFASQRSRESSSEMDDFLLERMRPVILRGQGNSENLNTTVDLQATASEIVDESKASFLGPSKTSGAPAASANKNSRPLATRPVLARRMPSDSSADDIMSARRSSSHLSKSEAQTQVRVPAPIRTRFAPAKTSLDSYDAEGSAGGQTDNSTRLSEEAYAGGEGLWLRPAAASRSRETTPEPTPRANFYQRAKASQADTSHIRQDVHVHVDREAIDPDVVYHGVVQYTMLDNVEPVALDDAAKLANENTSPEDSMSESHAPSNFNRLRSRQSKILRPGAITTKHTRALPKQHVPPPKIMVRPDSSEASGAQRSITPQFTLAVNTSRPSNELHVADQREIMRTPVQQPRSTTIPGSTMTPAPQAVAAEESPARVPRLSPVGRIPKVVSKRDREIKPSINSFSRPFGTSQPKPSVKPPGSLYSQIRELASPVEGAAPFSNHTRRESGSLGHARRESGSVSYTRQESVPINQARRESVQRWAVTTAAAVPPAPAFFPPIEPCTVPEFLTIPQKFAHSAYSTSSGTNSITVPSTIVPVQLEDEWNEYDDWLDEVALPNVYASAPSTGSSFGAPFQYANMLYDRTSVSAPPPLDWAQTSQLPTYSQAPTNAEVLSVQQQIARFMQPSMSPLSPAFTTSDVMNQYNNRSTSGTYSTFRMSIPSYNTVAGQHQFGFNGDRGSKTSSRNSRSSAHSRSASLPQATLRQSESSIGSGTRFRRDTQLLDIAEVDTELNSTGNLRWGALMTSKWLSAGKVLISPAHNEMRLADDPRILIIDGMGADWSYYVALSYPSATVYNLGPAPSNGHSTWPGVNEKPPSNHRHINHTSIDAAFPFPKSFFTAVVFRFPKATTDDAFHACVFECKRVLRPGGYLEVAVLDLDLTNMGNKARTAVRGLKIRMQQKDDKVSLRNLSDALVRLIARRGFEEIQRFISGVPASGSVPRSTDNSSDDSHASASEPLNRASMVRQSTSGHHISLDKEFSFADLLEDVRNNASAPQNGSTGRSMGTPTPHDIAISKMVARVGRWWYSTCYEEALLAANDGSIWNDDTLLHECEKQRTRFRLLLCYAQKPSQPRRRTVSV